DVLDDTVSVVSVMLANNEVGTVEPLDAVVAVVRERAPGAVLHTDAVQAFPWVDVAVLAAGADLVAVAAHKFGGPKGVGGLGVRERRRRAVARARGDGRRPHAGAGRASAVARLAEHRGRRRARAQGGPRGRRAAAARVIP